MNFNNAPMVQTLASRLDSNQKLPLQVPTPRRRLTSEPCLPVRLPSDGFIQREADSVAPKAILKQLRRSPSPPNCEPESEETHRPTRRASVSSVASDKSSAKASLVNALSKQRANGSSWRQPQPFEILRAIEQKDIMFLMEVRDRAFPLLLQKIGPVTPLTYVLRIGSSHRDVAILLVGAFSRWVNHLDGNDIPKPGTKDILKALRTNLKLGIDEGLASSQSDLTASFLQTLVMSEGDEWVKLQVASLSRALSSGTSGQPVNVAGVAVRRFATKALVKADLIASLEDYIANATADLLMLSAWSSAMESIPGTEKIPYYFFARDDRVYKAFVDKLDKYKVTIQLKLTRRLKWQLRVLKTVMEGRMTTYRRKVEMLASELDEGDGV